MADLTLEPKKSIAYGAIYLDAGENVEEETKKQIESFREQLPSFVFFDILAKDKQVAEAIASRAFVEQELKAELSLENVQVYVAIGYSEEDRPARTTMMKYIGA
jgi:hypothetical protein